MHFWEELEDCKFIDNEFLVDHLVKVVKDEGINNLEELSKYENDYFTESNMTREEWVGWYQKSLEIIPEIEGVESDPVVDKIRELRSQIFSTSDINLKIKNIIIVCALLEREFCFLVEAYNLVMGGKISLDDQVVRKNIVLCGSVKVKEEIIRVANILINKGFNILLPEECMRGEVKVVASRAHFDRITNPNNEYILIVNVPKNGVENYIGPNSFAEIAMAFYHNKRIYLLNDIYEPYIDELTAWGVHCLNGNIDNIK